MFTLQAFAVFVLVARLGAQQLPWVQSSNEPSAEVRKLGLDEIPGRIAVVYVPGARKRAIRLQKSLEAACSWYEEHLHVQVPMMLVVLDEEGYRKFSGHAYMPYYLQARKGPSLVIMPDRSKPPFPPPPNEDSLVP